MNHKNEHVVLNMFLALFGKNNILDFFYLEVDLLTLKMILNHENNIRNGFPGQNYSKIYYICCYLYLLKKQILPLN